jgi:hypothetical protein
VLRPASNWRQDLKALAARRNATLERLKTGRIILLALLLSLAILGIALWPRSKGEPIYQGRPLSGWIEDYYSAQPKEKRDRAIEAVQHIGTNALPFLMAELCSRDTRTRTKLYELATKQHLVRVPLWPGYFRRQRATVGFKMLGPTAKPVVPELIKLLEDSNTSISVRYEAATVLGRIGPEAKAAVPVLLRLLTEPDQYMRIHAASSLGDIGADAERVVPALVGNLAHSNRELRYVAAVSIRKFGARAESALPALRQAGKDSDRDVRERADLGVQTIERALRDR